MEEGRQADVTGLISEDGTVALEVEAVLDVDPGSEAKWTIFPNPVVDQLNLTLENEYFGVLSIRIYDMNGRAIHTFIHEKNSVRLSIQERLEIPTGAYIIHVIGGELNLQQRLLKR